MIDRQTAEQIANQFINSLQWNETGHPLMIVTEVTMERDYGWVFFYVSELYVKTKDDRFRLSGNVPIVVEKSGSGGV